MNWRKKSFNSGWCSVPHYIRGTTLRNFVLERLFLVYSSTFRHQLSQFPMLADRSDGCCPLGRWGLWVWWKEGAVQNGVFRTQTLLPGAPSATTSAVSMRWWPRCVGLPAFAHWNGVLEWQALHCSPCVKWPPLLQHTFSEAWPVSKSVVFLYWKKLMSVRWHHFGQNMSNVARAEITSRPPCPTTLLTTTVPGQMRSVLITGRNVWFNLILFDFFLRLHISVKFFFFCNLLGWSP